MSSETNKVVHFQSPGEGMLQTAQVTSIQNKQATISVNGLSYSGQVAFSCLVHPEVGDIVLWSRSESGINYILGIAERPDEQDATLAFPANANLHINGSLNVISSESITLLSAEKMTCVADQTFHKSRETVIDYDKTTARGDSLDASLKNIRLYSSLIQTMAKQVFTRAKDYFRRTEGSDEIQAKQMTRTAKGIYSMESKYTVMVSKKDTKIDGERIHMG
jgi:hypothetical protein